MVAIVCRRLFFPPRPSPEKKRKIRQADSWSEGRTEGLVVGLEEASLATWLSGYTSLSILFVIGLFKMFFVALGMAVEEDKAIKEDQRSGYTPLYSRIPHFLVSETRRRIGAIMYRPIASVPGAQVDLIDRLHDKNAGRYILQKDSVKTYLNFGSYNYLGFAENSGPVTSSAIESVQLDGLAHGSPRSELGSHRIHSELEATVADFLGVDEAITFGMGFATNALNLPCLAAGPSTLVLSDAQNHASIVLGMRNSGSTVKVFRHNDIEHLEQLLHECSERNRRTRQWTKILIVVEGIYSLEGTIVRLPGVMALKKKYGAYLYLDEAHSVGAMGPTGRSVVEYFGLNPRDVDIMMGTFTKSFGAAGGYIAGSKRLVDFLRVNSQASHYPTSMSAPVARQIISSMREIMTGAGMKRIVRLRRNSRYFRRRLQRLGCVVYGHDDSPVVPLVVFHPLKLYEITMELYHKGIAVVGCGYPATGALSCRLRFCVSAWHTKDMLDRTLDAVEDEIKQGYIQLSTRSPRDGRMCSEPIDY